MYRGLTFVWLADTDRSSIVKSFDEPKYLYRMHIYRTIIWDKTYFGMQTKLDKCVHPKQEIWIISFDFSGAIQNNG